MSNLSNGVAAANSEFPSQSMPDVIDSLKRLERVGSEYSKTTQKLISAASDLEDVIVALAPFKDFHTPLTFWRSGSSREEDPGAKPPYELSYSIKGGRLIHGFDGSPVSQDRTSAMWFAEDIADGLLEVIEAKLSHCEAEAAPAVETLEKVLHDLGKRPQVLEE